MDTKNKIKTFLHAFFVIKKEDFYQSNKAVIHAFKKKPGLYHIARNRQIGVEEVYNIVKTHDINVLNTNIIKLMESK
jgi:DNA-binding phage protein